MKFRLNMNMDNDAFILGDAGPKGERVDGSEIARILRELALKFDNEAVDDESHPYGFIRDGNGNKVGEWGIEE